MQKIHLMMLIRPDINQILNIIEHYYPLKHELKLLFAAIFHFELKEQGTKILNQREIQTKIWFIIKGSARAFKNDGGGKSAEHTIWFWFPDDVILNPQFYDNGLSPYTIEVIQDSYLAYIDTDDMETLKKAGLNMVELIAKIRTHYDLLYGQHWEDTKRNKNGYNYQQLLKKHPSLFNHAKLKDIASFLGMAADTLYKLRKESGKL